MKDVSIAACGGYEEDTVLSALRAVLQPVGGLDWVKPGMTVAIKANLISAIKPDAAATTHPAVIAAMVKLLQERGAAAIVGDSLSSDILGGVNGDLDTIWYNPKHKPNGTDIRPTWEADSFNAVKAVILGEG